MPLMPSRRLPTRWSAEETKGPLPRAGEGLGESARPRLSQLPLRNQHVRPRHLNPQPVALAKLALLEAHTRAVQPVRERRQPAPRQHQAYPAVRRRALADAGEHDEPRVAQVIRRAALDRPLLQADPLLPELRRV